MKPTVTNVWSFIQRLASARKARYSAWLMSPREPQRGR